MSKTRKRKNRGRSTKVCPAELKRRQAWPLGQKVEWALHQIRLWYEYWDGQVYVSFSGGKDSTVLLHLVRSLYPDVVAVFCNTGLEFPEIIWFIRGTPNVVWLKPTMTYPTVIEQCGWPVISKRVARYVWDLRRPKGINNATKHLRLTGENRAGQQCPSMKLPEKWRYLVKAPFLISHKCCDVMKKNPMHRYQTKTRQHPIIGTMASDSLDRRRQYKRTGCNIYKSNEPMSRPLSIWTTEDVWKYTKQEHLPQSSIYLMGYERTGCVFCAFGAHMEKPPNRFQQLKKTHPKLWRHCMNKLGMREVLAFVGVSVE